MDSDRKLLELAARAIGGKYCGDGALYLHGKVWPWQPLDDYGDALLLAEKLEINIGFCKKVVAAYSSYKTKSVNERHSPGAVKRAIVRAAAEIGRNML